jgi:membrane-associated phospholipid phosphatase
MRRAATIAAAVALGVALLAAARPAHAGESDELEVSRPWGAGFVLVGGLSYILSESVFKADLVPDGCRWCDGDELNALDEGARDLFKWDDTHAAATWSNVTGYVGAPVIGMGLLSLAAWRDDRLGNVLDDQIIVLEAVVGAALLNQAVKFVAGRERPFVRALPADQKGLVDGATDNNLSFYSGHTSLGFSFACAAGTVASLRGYDLAPWIWGSGLTLATATGLLRIGADKHYATDVLTGAVVGSAVGVLVPLLLHRRDGDEAPAAVGADVGPGGATMITWGGSF